MFNTYQLDIDFLCIRIHMAKQQPQYRHENSVVKLTNSYTLTQIKYKYTIRK